MPSKSAKQHRLMAAVAHNPAFAKKVGIPQSVGKDYAAADKGKKFRTGGLPASINKQDTRHGKMDMPFKSLKRFTGFKSGGKVRRYAEGDVVDMQQAVDDSRSFKDAFRMSRDSGDKTFMWRGKSYSTNLAAPKKPAADYGDKTAPMVARAPKPMDDTSAVSGRAAPISRRAPSAEDKQGNTERLGQIAETAMMVSPAGAVRGALTRGIAMSKPLRAAFRSAAEGTAKQVAEKRAAQQAAKEAAYDSRRAADMEAGFRKGGVAKYAKGGMMKESKEMVKKEVEFFKKKGAPKSMIKHEQEEVKGMKMGGMTMRPRKDVGRDQMMMAPYKAGGMARGGGVESRGKTKGTMIKMAGGGYVRSADGIASKGKTKGKMC